MAESMFLWTNQLFSGLEQPAQAGLVPIGGEFIRLALQGTPGSGVGHSKVSTWMNMSKKIFHLSSLKHPSNKIIVFDKIFSTNT